MSGGIQSIIIGLPTSQALNKLPRNIPLFIERLYTPNLIKELKLTKMGFFLGNSIISLIRALGFLTLLFIKEAGQIGVLGVGYND
ncbi:hypothetical protein HZS_5587 [Henneguya salminicola]|nr:hypothetical protein HZS_5587 [Henneguya salminicola]